MMLLCVIILSISTQAILYYFYKTPQMSIFWNNVTKSRCQFHATWKVSAEFTMVNYRISSTLWLELVTNVFYLRCCSLYFILFLKNLRVRGIQWSLIQYLGVLDYAENICLLSNRIENMQEKVNLLLLNAKEVGPEINVQKTMQIAIQMNNRLNMWISSNTWVAQCRSQEWQTTRDKKFVRLYSCES